MKKRTLLFISSIVGIVLLGIGLKMGGYIFSGDGLSSGKVLPISEWEKNLIGKWKFNFKDKNLRDYWKINGNIEFYENKTFKIQVTSNYFSLRANDPDEKKIISGGYFRGQWKVNNTCCFELFNLFDCSISNSYTHFQYDDKSDIGCPYFIRRYGNIDENFKTTVIKFTNNVITIVGNRYSDEGHVSYLFERISEK